MATPHDTTAARIAKKERTRYNPGPGPDINTRRRVIEVETRYTVHHGFRHLRGFRRPVYIAGAAPDATKMALKAAVGTTVGVMDHRGKVLKRSTRRRQVSH